MTQQFYSFGSFDSTRLPNHFDHRELPLIVEIAFWHELMLKRVATLERVILRIGARKHDVLGSIGGDQADHPNSSAWLECESPPFCSHRLNLEPWTSF